MGNSLKVLFIGYVFILLNFVNRPDKKFHQLNSPLIDQRTLMSISHLTEIEKLIMISMLKKFLYDEYS